MTVAACVEERRSDDTPAPPRLVRRPTLRAGHYVRLAVSDTGTGMTPEVLARVVEPFFTTKPAGKGTGLGLAMADGFAARSGGGLGIDSTPGQGTTVTLWLPVATGPLPRQAVAGAPDPQAGTGGSRILVVDDDKLIRELLAEQLANAGHAVTVAEDGAAALAVLDTAVPIDLLLTDLSMPGVDGVALIHAAQRRRPGLPAILLTGFAANAADLTPSAFNGGFSLLRKPVTERALADSIQMLLEERRISLIR